MANTITISVSSQDLAELNANPGLSPSKLFRSAMKLHRAMPEFLEVYDISDFVPHIRLMQDRFQILGKEIQRRQERIDSLQDVLAQKELAERRLRAPEQTNYRPVEPTSTS